jgi:undecaprenyl-phosphate 4-deoxy-4-formamido-L-arabinose transferase
MISIIIPVFNSELTIETLVDNIVKNLNEKLKFEIILVNDCSEDDSENLCKGLVEKFSNVSLFSLSKNFGEHNAIMAGLSQSIGDHAVIMSDDLQHSIEALIKLIDYGIKEKENFDVVYTYYEKKKYGFFKNKLSELNNLVANYLLEKPKDLYLSSFKFINRFIINEIIKNNSPFVYIDGLILGTTNKIGKIKVEHVKRSHGKSGYTIIKMLKLWSNMTTSFSIFPLRLSMLMGTTLSFIGFILAFIFFIERIVDSTVPSGFASIFLAVTIFSGVILIALGVIGEYIGRIFISQNQKPQFIIKNSWKKNK